MHQIKIKYYKSPFGELVLGSFEDKLCLCDWRYRKMRNSIDKSLRTRLNADFVEEKTSVVENTISQLGEYFDGKRTEFKIPFVLIGSDFQKRVWNELLQIPYGKTESYLGLSKKMGDEKAIRAVAAANGANQISIIVPCHRIIGKNGKLVGYAGGLPVKMKLLNIENAIINGQFRLF